VRQILAVQQIDDLMHDYQGTVPGASLAVLRDGAPILNRAYGFADMEGRVAASTATNYRLASMSKQFTSAAVLLLAEQGRLSIDDPIRRWLPTLPDAADGMIVRHLLTHTSGLIDYEDVIPQERSAQLRDDDVLRLLEGENRRHFPPGSQYRYSNSGYALLALIVERASGERYAEFLHKRIFQPLDMRSTVAFEAGVSAIAHRAFGYSAAPRDSAAPRSWLRTDQSLTSATLGDGGIYSSVDDLAKWDAALSGDRLLRPASLRLAFRAWVGTDDPQVQYGFGWRITGDTRWHSGETLGFRNVIVRYLERRLTILVLTNRNEPVPYATAIAIAREFLPAPDAEEPALEAAASIRASGPDPGARPLPRRGQ
jgi:CubicO group peptidase (beta-lactamase class C family)